jgi:uncharacterized protein YndB with AHSA1/START domain
MPELQTIGAPQNNHAWVTRVACAAKAALNTLVPAMASILLAPNLVGSAEAEVKSVAPNGFEVVDTAAIQAAPERVYAALGQIGQWWSNAHTFSHDAANLSLDLKAGGCFCERLKDGGSVQHLSVVYAAPGEGLRLRGALGPLQMEGVDGTLAWALKPTEGGTAVTQSYVVGGYIRSGMDQWAQRVDRVLHEQLDRLKLFVEGKPLN